MNGVAASTRCRFPRGAPGQCLPALPGTAATGNSQKPRRGCRAGAGRRGRGRLRCPRRRRSVRRRNAYFLPEPQGHGSFRPTFFSPHHRRRHCGLRVPASRAGDGGRCRRGRDRFCSGSAPREPSQGHRRAGPQVPDIWRRLVRRDLRCGRGPGEEGDDVALRSQHGAKHLEASRLYSCLGFFWA
jgi:hypothetical protein